MKILHIISSANPIKGGPIQGIRNYDAAMAGLVVQREVVCFDNQEDIEKWQFPATLKVVGLGNSKTGWQYNKLFIPWLEKNIKNYDNVILNGMWSYHTYATLRVVKRLKKSAPSGMLPAVFLMPHGMLDPWFQKDNSRRWKAIRNYFYWHFIEKKVVKSVDGLLFTCEDELLLARTTFSGYRPKKEINVGYGIVEPPVCTNKILEEFYKKSNLSKEDKYFLFLSRIHPKKGIDLLLKVYNQISNEKLPYLVIAGPGIETNYGQSLYNYVNKNNLQNKVKFLDHISGDTKWGALYGCEAFVLPSHQENFGIAVAEALACSKPVLITDKINIYREIEKEFGGIINDDTQIGTEKSILQWISLSSQKKEELGVNARRVYEKYFTIEEAAKKLVHTLKTLKS